MRFCLQLPSQPILAQPKSSPADDFEGVQSQQHEHSDCSWDLLDQLESAVVRDASLQSSSRPIEELQVDRLANSSFCLIDFEVALLLHAFACDEMHSFVLSKIFLSKENRRVENE